MLRVRVGVSVSVGVSVRVRVRVTVRGNPPDGSSCNPNILRKRFRRKIGSGGGVVSKG